MKNREVVGFIVAAISLFSTAQKIQTGGSYSTGHSVSARRQVVPDLPQRLAKFRQVQMPFDAAKFSAREQKMIAKLADACRYLDDIYWRQVDPEGRELYQSLLGSNDPRDVELRRYLWINGSRFDLTNGDKPFVGNTPRPDGKGFFPQGLTREQVEQYVKEHPQQRAEIYSPTTILRWQSDQRNSRSLVAIPYHVAYGTFLE